MVLCECGLRINAHQLQQHWNGQRHQDLLRKQNRVSVGLGAAQFTSQPTDDGYPKEISCTCGLTVKINSGLQMQAHLNGKSHRSGVRSNSSSRPAGAGSNGQPIPSNDPRPPAPEPSGRPAPASVPVRCFVCNIVFESMQMYDTHRQGAQHQRVRADLAAASGARASSPGPNYCAVCEREVPVARWSTHIAQDQYHIRRQRFAEVTAQAAENKNGIVVSGAGGVVDFGIVEADIAHGLSAERTLEVTVSNEVQGGLIALARVGFSSSLREEAQTTSFSAMLRGTSRFINRSQPRSVVVTFHPSYIGRFEDTLEFEFHDVESRERFVIFRRVTATVGSASDYELLKPKGQYIRPLFVPLEHARNVIPVSRPPTWTNTPWVVKCGWFPVPEALEKVFNTGKRGAIRGEVKRRFLPATFSSQTYAKHFQTLLYLEELHLSLELSRLDLKDTALKAEPPRYRLSVPGLAEGKPSLLVGDRLLVQKSENHSDAWYEGVVHRLQVESKWVTIHLDDKFSLYNHPSKKVDVRFKLNRISLRRAHQAVTLQNTQSRFLFPRPEDVVALRRVNRAQIEALELEDETLGANPEQMGAIAAIVNMPPGSVPFVVYGPPGTGKTVTIIEAIHQILKHDPHARVLACAPSNKAADLLVEKLADLGNAQLFRLNALWRKPDSEELKDSVVLDFSLINGNDVFVIPEKEVLQAFRVVVCTCVSGGIPYGLGMERGWFSHIFVDEAGQSMEPHIMIPIMTMANERTNIILAGDVQQMGPVTRSTLARELGLQKSYLQRLMSLPTYDLQTYMGLTVMKLLKHWRSHPAIINFANRQFYNRELQPCGDPAVVNSMLRSDLLVSKTFPIVFHAVSGKDEQEEGSPSYFNIDEAVTVKKYCEALVSDRKVRIRDKEIGVISPYLGQCGKIRRLFGRSDCQLEGIKVGTVEEFQGQERRVIIISTVRSRKAQVIHDIRRDLGFVGDAKRLNVAITRARAMLVIIGDPTVLLLDPTWGALLKYIRENGGWRGKDIDLPSHTSAEEYIAELQRNFGLETQEVIQRLKSLVIEKHVGESEIPRPDDLDSDEDIDGEGYMDGPAMEVN